MNTTTTENTPEELLLEEPITYTDAELEEMARLDEMRNKYGRLPHEL